MASINRRNFIKATTAAGLSLGVSPGVASILSRRSPNETLICAVMGTNGRGSQLAKVLSGIEGTEVAYICDPDDDAIAKGLENVTGTGAKAPEGVKDFRRALDDASVDALVIAAPDHWHAPAAIMACKAGKHVYVEKPCGHNAREGELLVQAARKHNRVVQMGNQRRSWPNVIQGVNALHEGVIGRVYFAKAWDTNRRQSIGYGKTAAVAANLVDERWQGPATRRAYVGRGVL
jgi:predicted dehydrogenase